MFKNAVSKIFRATSGVCLVVALMCFSMPEKCFAWDLWTTSPWLTLIADFLGGVNVEVHPLSSWGNEGELIVNIPRKVIPQKARIVSLDRRDSRNFKLVNLKKNLFELYREVPIPRKDIDRLFADPAALPFIGQRMLRALGYFDPKHYTYYQRRLAEFQTRMESTIQLGRQLLEGTEILDLSGTSHNIMRAAGCVITVPPQGLLQNLEEKKDTDGLKKLIHEAKINGQLVVADGWTSSFVREVVSKEAGTILLPRPDFDQELLISFYDQYLQIWNMVRR